ncbi:hypothetical protein ARMGADRAFT_1090504 [Armillaria gallica]|uniref:Uncharacterized protein n=1 Tax=Armillaria gallica TaxID=47427 RepID=A0A2H3CLP4_ARMGA|nr:hypothetical protein ARMGADRAFT_1090504 [Armillaria gallica]
MDTEVIPIFSDDELEENLEWVENEWIECGRLYRNIPHLVMKQRERILRIPAPFKLVLPSSNLSIIEFLDVTLPRLCSTTHSVLELEFSDDEPDDLDDPTTLHGVAIPSLETLNWLEEEFGQEWFNGKKSVRDERSRRHPFRILTYFYHMRQACIAFKQWEDADRWLKKRPESVLFMQEEEDLKKTATTVESCLMARIHSRNAKRHG